MSFAKEVKEKLKGLDIKPFVEKKGERFSYLSWAKAWDLLTDLYPESSFTRPETVFIGNATAEIYCSVTVAEGDKSITREAWLPVMNHTNRAIENPTTRDISDARWRCLVKCIALHGLGIHLYQGEDIPISIRSYTDEEYNTYKSIVETGLGFKLFAFVNNISEEASNDLYNSAEQGKKVEFKKRVDKLMAEGVNQWMEFESSLTTALTQENEIEVKTLIDEMELTIFEKAYLKQRLGDDVFNQLIKLYKQA